MFSWFKKEEPISKRDMELVGHAVGGAIAEPLGNVVF